MLYAEKQMRTMSTCDDKLRTYEAVNHHADGSSNLPTSTNKLRRGCQGFDGWVEDHVDVPSITLVKRRKTINAKATSRTRVNDYSLKGWEIDGMALAA